MGHRGIFELDFTLSSKTLKYIFDEMINLMC